MSWVGDLVPLAPFVMIILIVLFASQTKKAQARHRAEMQKELLAKFSSAQELAEFLKTDGGKLLMPEPTPVRTPATRAGVGILVLIIGIGILLASTHPPDAGARAPMQTGGLIVIAAGVGLVISAFVSRRLSLKWGADNQQQ